MIKPSYRNHINQMSSNDFKHFIACKGNLEVYLGPCQTSIMEHFSKIESKKVSVFT